MEENKNLKNLKQGISLDTFKNYSVEKNNIRNKLSLETKDSITSPKNSSTNVNKSSLFNKQLVPIKTNSGKLDTIRKSTSKKNL
jgi:hypothetical protein